VVAAAAAAAVRMDLVGVDIVAVGRNVYVVIELNGAVDFDERYSLHGGDVFERAAAALGLLDERPAKAHAGWQSVHPTL
jgi:glutathione synthase/RimK-type ligase-like ATP-grasp enzyme